MKTPITYYGGKQTMLKHILPLIPEHTLYTELFCGGCAVLFAKEPVDCEVINDLDRSLVNFYLVAKRHYQLLKEEIDATLHCRDQHAHARHILKYPDFFSPAQWAWAVWTMSKIGFASKQDGTFGYDRIGTTTQKVANTKDAFTEDICRRLENVTVENDDALRIIKWYDREGAFHFVDPPYINSDCGHYEGLFNPEDMQRLIELLAVVRGKFMLTMYPYDAIGIAAAQYGWIIHRVERTISASKDVRRKQEEWIVCNYEIERAAEPRTLFSGNL